MDTAARCEMLEKRCEKLQMQVDKLCEILKVGLDYQPHSYNAYELPKEDENG